MNLLGNSEREPQEHESPLLPESRLVLNGNGNKLPLTILNSYKGTKDIKS